MSFDTVIRHVSPSRRFNGRAGCECRHSGVTGAMQRANPLPAGRYWVDVFGPDSDAFNAWLSSNKATVIVRSTEHFDSVPVRDWYLFEVSAPTPWSGPGFPSIAPPNITTSSDTAQTPPPPPGIAQQLEDDLKGGFGLGATFTKGLLGVLAGALVVEVAIHVARGGGR